MGRLGYLAVLAGVLSGCVPLSFRGQAPRDGSAAPPTRGIDVAGQPLDLGEYRGKVVLLGFWHSS
jgi:hypothetical protein